MLRLLLPVVLALLGLGAGAGAALFLAPAPEPDVTAAPEAGDEAETDTAPSAPVPTDEVEYARLSNQFIVPVIDDAAVEALVVLSITLEVEPGSTEEVFGNEPRLRDRFLRVLFDHANIGGFDAGFTQSGTMTLLRNALLDSARETLGPLVYDVLIVDIVRQDT